jgi:hypothetical protein
MCWTVQSMPPFVVLIIVPLWPQAIPLKSSMKKTLVRRFPWGFGFCHSHPVGCADTVIESIKTRRDILRIRIILPRIKIKLNRNLRNKMEKVSGS